MTIHEAIVIAWTRFQDRVERTRDWSFDHEFTLQFHLAWEVARSFSFSDNLGVQFEVPCGRDVDGKIIRLDLLLWIDPRAKVAVELKAPLRSETGKGSPVTQFRMRFYKDLHRLRHLVATGYEGIASGCFLALTNERDYVLEQKKRVNLGYRTYHRTIVPPAAIIPAHPGSNGCSYELKMPGHEIRWEWICQQAGKDILYAEGMRHFWLKPIFVERTRTV